MRDNGRYAFLEDVSSCRMAGYSTPPVVQSFQYSPIYAMTNPDASYNYYGSCKGCSPSKRLSTTDAYSNESCASQRGSCENMSISGSMKGGCNRIVAGDFANRRKESFEVDDTPRFVKRYIQVKDDSESFVPDKNSNFDSCRRQKAPQLKVPLSPRPSVRDRQCQSCDGACPNGYGCTKFVSAFDDCQSCSEGMVTYGSVSKPVEYGGSYGSKPNLRNVSPGVRASCNCGRCNFAGCNRHFV